MSRNRASFDRSMLEAVKRHLKTSDVGGLPTTESFLAWRRFYHLCDPLIRRFVRIYVRTANDMDDCTQEVWVRLIKHLKTFDYDASRGAFSSWLYKVVRSVTANYFRHDYRNNDGDNRSAMSMIPAGQHSDPATIMDAMDSQHRAEEMLITIRRNVSRPNYELLYMRWVQQRSVEDVANTLDISREQVWYREHRVKKKLRDVLANRRP